MSKIRQNIIFYICACLFLVTLTGCFTGIESTKKIKMSREEKRSLEPTAEELFLNDIKATPHTSWPVGKEFIVVGRRGSVLFEPRRIVSGNYQLEPGDTLRFLESRMSRQPDGLSIPSLTFARGEDQFRYIPSGKSFSEGILSDAIPGLIDPVMLEAVGSRMRGKAFWTRNTLRENEAGDRIEGKKFERIDVIDVQPGNMVFPIMVIFRDSQNRNCRMYLNFGNTGKDSRSFANMLRLTDPRGDYPAIADNVWENIMAGRVETGMTREECRLAKGNPSDVNAGHDYQHTLLIWSYPDGSVLYFVDNILRGVNSVPEGF